MKIKMCPHCNGFPSLEESLTEFWIKCTNCKAKVGGYLHQIDVINNWNQRVTDDKYNELVEFIKSMILPSCGYLLSRLACDAEELLRKHGVEV